MDLLASPSDFAGDRRMTSSPPTWKRREILVTSNALPNLRLLLGNRLYSGYHHKSIDLHHLGFNPRRWLLTNTSRLPSGVRCFKHKSIGRLTASHDLMTDILCASDFFNSSLHKAAPTQFRGKSGKEGAQGLKEAKVPQYSASRWTEKRPLETKQQEVCHIKSGYDRSSVASLRSKRFQRAKSYFPVSGRASAKKEK